jgi:hypothetical protein
MTMRFMMLMIPEVYRKDAPADFKPDPAAMDAMGKFNEAMRHAGILLALDGLHPPATGARVSFADGRASVDKPPYAGASEALGGYWVIDVKSADEAVAWATRCPAAPGDVIEVRRVFEMADFQ